MSFSQIDRQEQRALLADSRTLSYPVPSASSTDSCLEIAKQALVNSYKQKASILVLSGLTGVILSIYIQLFKQEIILFTWHPFFNTIGLVLLGLGVIIVQPEPLSDKHKSLGGAIHGILNSVATLSFIVGTSFIWLNKHIHGAAHITTWHSTFGIVTVVYMSMIMLFGSMMYWFPVKLFGSVAKAKSYYKYHRLGGFLAFGLVLFTVGLALESDFNHNALHIKYTTLGLSLVIVFVGLLLQLKPFKYGF